MTIKCELLKIQDERYHTSKRSPLHHDNVCNCDAAVKARNKAGRNKPVDRKHPWQVAVSSQEFNKYSPKNRIVPQDRMGLSL